MGDDLSERWCDPAPPEPALRSLLRRRPAVPASVCRRGDGDATPPRRHHRAVSRGIRGGSHVGGSLSRAGRPARFPDFWDHDGPAPIDPGADRRHRDHLVGAAGASSGAIVSADPISRRIARRIGAEGPLSVAAFMAMALHDPEDGYYARRSPIGAQGDFITAPEISQVFGELIGLWCALMWQRLGEPDPIILAELGPGRGVLIEDLLRAAAAIPAFRRALRLHLVEASPALRAEQETRLAGLRPVWAPRYEDLPEEPMLLVANEFLDALPIRQFVRGRARWSERMVAVDDDNRFVFVDGPESHAASLLVPAAHRDSVRPGTVVEICPAALALAAGLGARFTRRPGAALFVDYGYFPSMPGSTLRAPPRPRPVSGLG